MLWRDLEAGNESSLRARNACDRKALRLRGCRVGLSLGLLLPPGRSVNAPVVRLGKEQRPARGRALVRFALSALPSASAPLPP
jgi:hypothetical protein